MDLPPIVYLTNKGVVTAYYVMDGYLVPVSAGKPLRHEKIKKDGTFTDLFEANYKTLCFKLSQGKKFSNYKRSKYYEQYRKRLRVEHPEYLI